MNKPKLVIILLWLASMWACDPCEDCGEPLVYDPFVRVVFINQDSISILTDSINANKDSIAELDTARRFVSDSIKILADTIDALDKLIASGNTQYEDDKVEFERISDSLNVVSDTLNSLKSQVGKLSSEMNKVVKSIQSGKLQLEQVTLTNINTEITFEDSMSSFELPLLLGTIGEPQEISYRVVIVGEVYDLTLRYETYETINAARVARVRARDTDTVSQSFDSLIINCRTSECISDETTLTAYF